MTLQTTLVLLKKHDKILLGLKKRGFGKGRLNGAGGKLEKGETPEECAIRETQEELGVKVTELEHVADIVFDDLYNKGVPERDYMHVYIATKWEGEPTESDEIKPEWFEITEMPYDKMWIDDAKWMPQVLRGHKLEAWFHFNENDTFDDFWVEPLNEYIIDDIDDLDVGLAKRKRRPGKDYVFRQGARAVLLDDKDRVALIHSVNRGWYKLPGGGREANELWRENLNRELLEETGYKVEIMQDLGSCFNTRHDWQMWAEARIYLCRTKEFIGKQPMEDEIEDGDTLEWFDTFDDAIAALKAVKLDEIGFYGAYFFTKREMDTLEYAKTIYRK